MAKKKKKKNPAKDSHKSNGQYASVSELQAATYLANLLNYSGVANKGELLRDIAWRLQRNPDLAAQLRQAH